MPTINVFAQQFAQLSQKSNKAEFEIRFNTIQRGLLTQLDQKKQAVRDNGVEQDIATLQARRDKLLDRADDALKLQFKLQSNANRMIDVAELANNTAGIDAEGTETLTQEQADTVNAAIATLVSQIRSMVSVSQDNPFTDTSYTNLLRHDALDIEGLSVVAGPIDAAGVDPATNNNRDVLARLASLGQRTATYAESASYLVENTNSLIVDLNSRAYGLEADLTSLTTVAIAEQQQQIEDLELRYGNLIRSISLSFEVTSGLADALAAGTDFKPEKGSVLNMFL